MAQADTMANFIEFPLMDIQVSLEQLTDSNNSLMFLTVYLILLKF